MSKRKPPAYVPAKRRRDSVADLSFYQLIRGIYRADWRLVDEALAGVRAMPLEALMHGMPPALGSLKHDFTMWNVELELEVDGYQAIFKDAATDAGEHPSHPMFENLSVAIGGDEPYAHHRLRLDYWRAVWGDGAAVDRLRDAYGSSFGLPGAFVLGLQDHARRRRSSSATFVWRVGVGSRILLSSVGSHFETVDRFRTTLKDVHEWKRASRAAEGEAVTELVRQLRDDAAMNAVDEANRRLDDDAARARQDAAWAKHCKEQTLSLGDLAGIRFVGAAFAAYRAKVAAGEKVTDAELRKTADDVLTSHELAEDRKIPVDVEDLDAAKRVVDSQIDAESKAVEDYAYAALHDDEKLLDLSKAKMGRPLKDRILRAGGTELQEKLAAMEANFARSFGMAVGNEAAEKAPPDFDDDIEVLAQALQTPVVRHVRVLETIDTTGMSRDRSELLDTVKHLGSGAVECAAVTGLAEARASLVGDYPHAVEIVDRILGDLQDGEAFKLRPTLLVGSPGSGKTSLLVDIVDVIGISRLVYSCAGVSDSSFVGTSAQWGSKRLSIPLELIKSSGIPNPVVILDEIEKSGSYSNGGRLHDALLPLLEGHSSSEFFEVGIEKKSNLSHVSYLATANTLDGLSAPLKDRFRVLRMPDPGPEHVGDLVRGIVGRIRRDRGVDDRWIPDLLPDEVEVVRKAWDGGSLRRLRRAVDATLDARETMLRGRAM